MIVQFFSIMKGIDVGDTVDTRWGDDKIIFKVTKVCDSYPGHTTFWKVEAQIEEIDIDYYRT